MESAEVNNFRQIVSGLCTLTSQTEVRQYLDQYAHWRETPEAIPTSLQVLTQNREEALLIYALKTLTYHITRGEEGFVDDLIPILLEGLYGETPFLTGQSLVTAMRCLSYLTCVNPGLLENIPFQSPISTIFISSLSTSIDILNLRYNEQDAEANMVEFGRALMTKAESDPPVSFVNFLLTLLKIIPFADIYQRKDEIDAECFESILIPMTAIIQHVTIIDDYEMGIDVLRELYNVIKEDEEPSDLSRSIIAFAMTTVMQVMGQEESSDVILRVWDLIFDLRKPIVVDPVIGESLYNMFEGSWKVVENTGNSFADLISKALYMVNNDCNEDEVSMRLVQLLVQILIEVCNTMQPYIVSMIVPNLSQFLGEGFMAMFIEKLSAQKENLAALVTVFGLYQPDRIPQEVLQTVMQIAVTEEFYEDYGLHLLTFIRRIYCYYNRPEINAVLAPITDDVLDFIGGVLEALPQPAIETARVIFTNVPDKIPTKLTAFIELSCQVLQTDELVSEAYISAFTFIIFSLDYYQESDLSEGFTLVSEIIKNIDVENIIIVIETLKNIKCNNEGIYQQVCQIVLEQYGSLLDTTAEDESEDCINKTAALKLVTPMIKYLSFSQVNDILSVIAQNIGNKPIIEYIIFIRELLAHPSWVPDEESVVAELKDTSVLSEYMDCPIWKEETSVIFKVGTLLTQCPIDECQSFQQYVTEVLGFTGDSVDYTVNDLKNYFAGLYILRSSFVIEFLNTMDVFDDNDITSECYSLFCDLWKLVPFTVDTFPVNFFINMTRGYESHLFVPMSYTIKQAVLRGVFAVEALPVMADAMISSFFERFAEENFEPAFDLLFFLNSKVDLKIEEILQRIFSENEVPQDVQEFFCSIFQVMSKCLDEETFSAEYVSSFVVPLACFINWRQNKP